MWVYVNPPAPSSPPLSGEAMYNDDSELKLRSLLTVNVIWRECVCVCVFGRRAGGKKKCISIEN